MLTSRRLLGVVLLSLSLQSFESSAIDVDATAKALRIANTITGGFMPPSDPLFAQMVVKVAAGDLPGAASIASNSKYFTGYLARRLAFQMQNPAFDPNTVTDSDATAFLIAKLAGTAATPPSISTIWSENATYLVNVGGTPVHAATLTPAQLAALDWSASLTRVAGQQVKSVANNSVVNTVVTLPPKHVGGYLTLSDRGADNSFAMFGATAGTNLRMIEGLWQIATGFTLLNVASTDARAQDVPRFIPEYDPNFFRGQGQVACIACHGGGMVSITHGYSAVADVFDYDPNLGLAFIATPTTQTRKSLGSDPGKRAATLTCDLVRNPTAVCNPDSDGVDLNQSWDLTKSWASLGILSKMGWRGPTSGQGLNELGVALGQANIVYEFLTKRVINEVCPLGTFSPAEISSIAAAANPFATPKGTDDVRTIVSRVATQASCL